MMREGKATTEAQRTILVSSLANGDLFVLASTVFVVAAVTSYTHIEPEL